MNDPKVILTDGPTGALDSKTAQNVIKAMHELNRTGHTIILVTHDSDLSAKAERIVELSGGKTARVLSCICITFLKNYFV